MWQLQRESPPTAVSELFYTTWNSLGLTNPSISVQAAMNPGESSSTEVALLEVVPGTVPAPAPSAPMVIVAPVASAAITTPLPQTYGGPGYPPVTFPGAYLDIPAGVSVTDSTVRWYCVTVGLRVGVFPHWYVFLFLPPMCN